MAKKRGFGTARSVESGGNILARNTELPRFRGRSGSRYVGVVSEFIPSYLHSVYRGKNPKTGEDSRTYLPCSKSVIETEGEDGTVHYSQGDEKCALCEMSLKDNDKCWWPKLHYAVYWAILARSDREGNLVQDQKLFIWSFREEILESFESVENIKPFATKLDAKCSGQFASTWTFKRYKGAKIEANEALQDAYADAEDNKWLQKFVEPPSYEEGKEMIQDHFAALEGGRLGLGGDDEEEDESSDAEEESTEDTDERIENVLARRKSKK